MFNDSNTTRRYPLRHPDNTNLHLYYGDTYAGQPLQVKMGPFVEKYLFRTEQTIGLALQQYPRVLAFRVDLRLPVGINLPEYAYTNEVISRFIESFKAKIEHNRDKARERNRYANTSKVRYVWAREVGQEGGRPHYHLLFLLNRDAFYTVGRLQSASPNMISRLEEAWASALGLTLGEVRGLVHIPDNETYRIDRDFRERRVVRSNSKVRVDELPALFYRASYLCKAATKSYGDRQRGFDTSKG